MEQINQLKVMFAGPSGIGKTTSAKFVAETLGIPFVSGSVSDLLPATKEMPHSEMLSRDSQALVMEDYQILTLRSKLFREHESFVSDRSFLDLAAYFWYKQADKLPQCEVEQFLDICKKSLVEHCTHLIVYDFTQTMLEPWVMEDNGKRITNKYFQMLISSIMKDVLKVYNLNKQNWVHSLSSGIFRNTFLEYGATTYELNTVYGTTKILVVKEVNLNIRHALITKFLNDKL